MIANADDLANVIYEVSQSFRKTKEAVVLKQIANVQVTDAFAMPEVPADQANLTMVDAHFIVIGVDKEKAQAHKEDIIDYLENHYPGGKERLLAGPSYIELGAELGSQDLALHMMAVCDTLGIAKMLTPKGVIPTLTGEQATALAGSGFILFADYKGPTTVA